MNKDKIGTNAGIIWDLLNNKKRWHIDELCKATGLSKKDTYIAIGWLAREDKIEIKKSDDSEDDDYYLIIEYYF